MPNWKSQESRDRLLAAVVASMDQKHLNYNRIAALFGQGTTYHAIEGQFRQVRKDAQRMREDFENGVTNDETPPKAPARSTGAGRRKADSGASGARKRARTASSDGKPSAKRDAVLAGRVTKSKSITPTNSNAKSNLPSGFENHNAVRGFKEEIESSEASAANTPAFPDPYDYSIDYDGANDSFITRLSTFDTTFGDSFATDASCPYEA